MAADDFSDIWQKTCKDSLCSVTDKQIRRIQEMGEKGLAYVVIAMQHSLGPFSDKHFYDWAKIAGEITGIPPPEGLCKENAMHPDDRLKQCRLMENFANKIRTYIKENNLDSDNLLENYI